MNQSMIDYTAGVAGTVVVKYMSTNCDRDYVRYFKNEDDMNRWIKKARNIKVTRATRCNGIGKYERIY